MNVLRKLWYLLLIRMLQGFFYLFLELFSEIHLLTTEFIAFSKLHKNPLMENSKLEVKGQSIEATNSVNYLGDYPDKNLTFQEEVKHVLRKLACGMKTVFFIRRKFPVKTRLRLLNALVIGNLHYPAILSMLHLGIF